MFSDWLCSNNPQPYNSFGNGSAMRVSPVVYFAKSLEEVKELSRIVTSVTHNHPEGIKGAEATAVAAYMALHESKKAVAGAYYGVPLHIEHKALKYLDKLQVSAYYRFVKYLCGNAEWFEES